MNDNVENLVLTPLRELRGEVRHYRDESRAQIAELRRMLGGQPVILTSIGAYIHGLEERIEGIGAKLDGGAR